MFFPSTAEKTREVAIEHISRLNKTFDPDLFAPIGLGLLLSLHFLPGLLGELVVTGGAPVGLPERLAGLGLLFLHGHGGSDLRVEVFVGGGGGGGQHQLLQGHNLSLEDLNLSIHHIAIPL